MKVIDCLRRVDSAAPPQTLIRRIKMAKKAYDVAVVVGEYQKDGETKPQWLNVGVVLKKDDGKPFMLLNRTFNPAGVPISEDNQKTVLLNFFVPKKNEEPADDGSSQI